MRSRTDAEQWRAAANASDDFIRTGSHTDLEGQRVSSDAIVGDSHNVAVGYNSFMKTTRQLTAIIEREDDTYVALCPELDIASQGDTVETARTNLIEALELFFESADPTEIARRLHSEVFITRVEVAVG